MTLKTIKNFQNASNPDYTQTIANIQARFDGGQQFVYSPSEPKVYPMAPSR